MSFHGSHSCTAVDRQRRSRWYAVFFVASTLLVAKCTSADRHEGTPAIYASTPVVAYIVGEVAGDDLRVESLIPPGRSPHAFELRPSDVRSLSQAALVVIAARNLDEWIAQLPSVPRVALMDFIPDSLTLPRGSQEPNPHFWMDPMAVRLVAGALAESLCEIEPERCERFRDNAFSMQTRLDSLHRLISDRVGGGPVPGLIVSHPFLDYFSARYGLRVLNIAPGSGSLEPSPGDMAQLITAARSGAYGAVATERSEPSAAARTIAEAAGLPLLSIDPIGGLRGLSSYDQILLSCLEQIHRADG